MNLHQISLLQSALNTPIVCNQLELSLTQIQWLEDGIGPNASSQQGTVEYCMQKGIQLQAWGCMSQGVLSGRDVTDQPDSIQNTARVVTRLANVYQVSKEAIVLAWLMRHPASIQPVIGTTNSNRIKACAEAKNVNLSREDWYQLYQAARGYELP